MSDNSCHWDTSLNVVPELRGCSSSLSSMLDTPLEICCILQTSTNVHSCMPSSKDFHKHSQLSIVLYHLPKTFTNVHNCPQLHAIFHRPSQSSQLCKNGCLDSLERGTVEWNSGTVEWWNSGMRSWRPCTDNSCLLRMRYLDWMMRNSLCLQLIKEYHDLEGFFLWH